MADIKPGGEVRVSAVNRSSCGWCRDPYCTGDHSGDAADEWSDFVPVRTFAPKAGRMAAEPRKD